MWTIKEEKKLYVKRWIKRDKYLRRRRRRKKKVVENYGHISRCDNIGMYARYIYINVCARFEKIFNDNRAHISIQVREKKRRNKKKRRRRRRRRRRYDCTISCVCRRWHVCMHCPFWKNEWMKELYEWMELLVMHCDLKANEGTSKRIIENENE